MGPRNGGGRTSQGYLSVLSGPAHLSSSAGLALAFFFFSFFFLLSISSWRQSARPRLRARLLQVAGL